MDIIDIFQEFCDDNKITLLTGPESYVNSVIDSEVYKNNDLVMILDLTETPYFQNKRIYKSVYQGVVALGRKRETDVLNPWIETESSLDETFKQKYNNRLKDLSNKIKEYLQSISCEYDFDILDLVLSYDLNKFDLNADFVIGTISFEI